MQNTYYQPQQMHRICLIYHILYLLQSLQLYSRNHVSKEDIDEAIAEIMRSDIPLNYVDECERAAFADGQGDALSKLKELLWRAADEDE